MSRVALRPYLITKDAEGVFRVTLRTTRFNSQGYPLVSSSNLDREFRSAAAARLHLRDEYRAVPTDIAVEAA